MVKLNIEIFNFILVFNSDSLYRAYKKRLTNMPFDRKLYEEQLKNPNVIFFIFFNLFF